MVEFPRNFDSRHWWILLGTAGALITAASAPVKFAPGFMIGLALLLFGVGQWVDHRIQTAIGTGFMATWQVTSYPWRPSFFGVVLSLGGAALFCVGLYRLLTL